MSENAKAGNCEKEQAMAGIMIKTENMEIKRKTKDDKETADKTEKQEMAENELV